MQKLLLRATNATQTCHRGMITSHTERGNVVNHVDEEHETSRSRFMTKLTTVFMFHVAASSSDRVLSAFKDQNNHKRKSYF